MTDTYDTYYIIIISHRKNRQAAQQTLCRLFYREIGAFSLQSSSCRIVANKSIFQASCKLTVVQRGIGAALFEKFLVIPLFDDIAVLHKKDIIGVADGR